MFKKIFCKLHSTHWLANYIFYLSIWGENCGIMNICVTLDEVQMYYQKCNSKFTQGMRFFETTVHISLLNFLVCCNCKLLSFQICLIHKLKVFKIILTASFKFHPLEFFFFQKYIPEYHLLHLISFPSQTSSPSHIS